MAVEARAASDGITGAARGRFRGSRLLPRAPRGTRGNEAVAGWIFVAPVVVILGLFLLLPIFMALWVSLTDWNGQNSPFTSDVPFVGADNYTKLFTEDGLARRDFMTSITMTAMVDLPFALPTAVAGIALTTLYTPSGWIGFVAAMVFYAFAVIAFFIAVSMIGPARTSLLSYAEPIVSAALGPCEIRSSMVFLPVAHMVPVEAESGA